MKRSQPPIVQLFRHYLPPKELFSPLIYSIVSIYLVLFLSVEGRGQISSQPNRPSVGVILSGGGAKGYAHVGVLKVLEEAKVSIDYIGGTSMGAIIGGLYASGYTAHELDSILRTVDIYTMLQDEIDRSSLPFHQKRTDDRYALSLSLRDFSIDIPAGFSEGQDIYQFLSRLTLHVQEVTDFSQLPIPFLCMATDLTTGEEVLMDGGYLPEAIRISGAFPTLLTPIEQGEMLLSDGGIINNIPVREVQEKGADILIAVSVEDGLYPKDELGNAVNILSQISTFQMAAKSKEQLALCDLVIQPEVKGFTVTSFDAVDTLIQLGQAAAREYWDSLLYFAQLSKAPQKHSSPARIGVKDSFQLASIVIDSCSVSAVSTLENAFPESFPVSMQWEEFFQRIDQLHATGQFRRLYYHFQGTPQGKVLRLKPKENHDSGQRMRLGLHYDGVYNTGILLNGTLDRFLFPNASASLDLVVGDRFRYRVDYFIDRGSKPSFGLSSRLQFLSWDFDRPAAFGIDNPGIREWRWRMADFNNWFRLRLAASRTAAFGLEGGLQYFRLKTDQVNFSEQTLETDNWYGWTSIFFEFDNLDRAYLPHSGMESNARFRGVLPLSQRGVLPVGKRAAHQFDIQSRLYLPVADRWVVHLEGRGGLFLDQSLPNDWYYLGGYNRNVINRFSSFRGLPFGRRIGKSLFSGLVGVRREWIRGHYLSAGGQHAWLEELIAPEDFSWRDYRSVWISYGVATPLGPVELTYARSNVGGQLYFNLGHWF